MTDIAVIQVRGKGSEYKELNKNTPTPLVSINNRTFLEILISFIAKSKIKKIYLLYSCQSEEFKKKYYNKNILGKKIILIEEKSEMGSGGSLYNLKNKIKKDFLLFDGNGIVNIDINKFIEDSSKIKSQILSMIIVKNKSLKFNKLLSSLNIDKNNRIFLKKKQIWMNSGIYYVNNKFFKNLKKGNYSFEKKILNGLICEKKVTGFKAFKDFLDIRTSENLKKKSIFVQKNFKENVIFLDRDGVINQDLGYVYQKKNFVLMSGVVKAIRYANIKGYHVICISNQSGVGRGMYSENDVLRLHNHLNKNLILNNCVIEKFYYCPHHPKFGIGKYKKNCLFRKPNPGMLNKAKKEFNINLKNCFMIGDQNTDYSAAKKAKINFYFKEKGSLFNQFKEIF